MRGKICLVTGGTSGIGAETARGLARLGATVVVVGRNAEKAAQVTQDLRAETANESIDFLVADLSSQKDIRALASEFRQRYDRLNVLVNNAGAMFVTQQLSVDGIEMTFALNHLGYFLLTNLLLDLLKASAPARIVNVASQMHKYASLDFDDVQGKSGILGMGAYNRSKLANVYFTYELARRLEGTGVTANTLHPGVTGSNMGMNNGGIGRFIKFINGLPGRSAAEAAQTSIYLASSPEVEGVTGKYFDKKKAIPSAKSSYAVEAAKRLWEISEQLTGLTPAQ